MDFPKIYYFDNSIDEQYRTNYAINTWKKLYMIFVSNYLCLDLIIEILLIINLSLFL